ncbi:hypothetical protein [Pseudomonas grimontii]|uniref:hypothetical protein n=1 Tax=Pseudomonas grimontii TaxID=129847 RepID=UPI0028E82A2A|nr:hypothetical protein [Pseudomonas grimontii]
MADLDIYPDGDNVPPPKIVDLTTFENGDWNGWTKGPAGPNLKIHTYLNNGYLWAGGNFDGPIPAGSVISKSYQLSPGTRYSFSIDFSKSPPFPIAQLALIAGSHSGPKFSISAADGGWETQTFHFTASTATTVLSLHSYEGTAPNLQFRIDNILLRES